MNSYCPIYTHQERNRRIFIQILALVVLWLCLQYGLLYLLYETALMCKIALYTLIYKIFFLRLNILIMAAMLFYVKYHLAVLKFKQSPPPKYKMCRAQMYRYGRSAMWKSYLFFGLLTLLLLNIISVLFFVQTPVDQQSFALSRAEQCQNLKP